ncbi:Chromodomain-helicase-DNA-binding protein 1-like [Collichthys lucidus]|uniref:Chromodomain-helicase-DNA-binding protein 1-like n=1 Tax=Collichthys lucidus TaxID=240159 RepID=A0A4U5UK07_COLLU|nr:Chromodomain-helicase-DNA-binding protein 1-like [Collichthys lucidus]
MTDILSRIKNTVAEKKKTSVSQSDLQKCGLTGIQLRPYQLDGVRWLTQSLKSQQGCILGDEMGLGKTCQLTKTSYCMSDDLSAGVRVRSSREERSVLGAESALCHGELEDGVGRVEVDRPCGRRSSQAEESKLTVAQNLDSVGFRVLLTGTPIQNNLQELYSLLSFIQPSIFTADETDDFVNSYSNVQNQPALAAELQRVLEPFLLRRVKSEVAVDLPKKTELVMYHGMSALQKKYYKALLMKDLEVFGNEQGNRNRLMNILMNLRKCVDHPYLFDGVEPEPFEMGEHLIEASGKLCLLDSMLTYLHKGGHRILLFSQLTRMLDILQDYMEYRGYSYERLDGSVRGEERNLAVKNFSSKQIFVFLLSTKAGGVGLNLTAADTVIFVDSDFNPQNDLQAAARCHRIGQDRPVKVVRLLARDTVEEIMYSRAVSKLHLTNTVIEEGRFSLLDQAQSAAAGLQLSEILKFGVDKLLSSEESSVQDVKLEKILGPSHDGQWVDNEDFASLREEKEEDESGSECDGLNHMYYFEGKDYSKDPSSDDQKSFDRLLEEQLDEFRRASGEGRALRHKAGVSLSVALGIPTRKRKPLTEAELELRRLKREEAAAKRAKLQEDVKKKQQEQKHKKKMAWWESCGYRSRCLPSVDSEGEEEEEEEEEVEEDDSTMCSSDSDSRAINYVLGDVTHPHAAQGDAIIVHCVDLELGNVQLFPIDDKQSRLDGRDQLALIVAQQRDKGGNLSGIRLTALEEGLKKIYAAAKKNKGTVKRLFNKDLSAPLSCCLVLLKSSQHACQYNRPVCRTYDGDEEEIMSPEVTHIVAEVENRIHSQELQDLVGQYPQAVPVQKDWLESSFSKQRKVNTTPFILHPL